VLLTIFAENEVHFLNVAVLRDGDVIGVGGRFVRDIP
jgi:hypothetical protein